MNEILKKVLYLLFFPVAAFAGIGEELEKLVDELNTPVNVTRGEVYKSQRAGHVTGGGITIRNNISHMKPLSVTLPHIDSGCGGIDLYTGAFSYINSDELINTLKSIASSSSGYAFFLALETVSPQIANNIKYLQELSMKANAININSCEAASQLVGAVWPRDTMAREHICKSMKSQRGRLADWVAGRHQCSNRGKKDDEGREENTDSSLFDNFLYDEYNIAWESMKKFPIISEKKEWSELFMTLMGTIVKARNENGEFRPEYFPAKALDGRFLNAFINGGNTTAYQCQSDKERCLWVKEVPYTISRESSLIGKVQGILLSIQQKILTESSPLTEAEQALIETSRFPLFRILNAMSAYTRGNNPIDIFQLADIVVMDVLLEHLKDVVQLVREGCKQLRSEQYFGNACDEYLAHLDAVERKVLEYERKLSDRMEKELHFQQKIRMMEEEMAEKLNISW